MAVTVADIKGLSELQDALSRLPGQMQEKLIVKRAAAGARLIANEMSARAPVRRGDASKSTTWKKRGHSKLREPGYLQKHINIKRMNRASGTQVTYQIGPTKGAFYARFLEFGTRFIAKRPFMRPAIDAKQGAAVDLMASIVKAGLDALVQEVK